MSTPPSHLPKYCVVSMRLLTSFCCLLAISAVSLPQLYGQDPFAEHVRKTEPLEPAAEAETFATLPGLAVDLIASEPEILKPLNMAFDWDGRLWVTCTREYPYPAKPGEGHDQIVVLEDSDDDGRFESRTVFADDLNIPIGIIPYGDGCIVFDIPNICYLSDNDGDGKYDQRKVLYGPFDYSRDTHGLNNSFRQGFDGWIYACHGFNNRSTVQGADGHQVYLQSGNTYRFRPDGSRIEQFSHGQVNPFGMAIDEAFRIFTADCHSKPLTQVVRNGYFPSFGRPDDGLGFAPSLMDHLHGSTAIAGVAFLEGDHWPAGLGGQLVSGNVMTSRVNRNKIINDGMTAIAVEQPDFLKTSDPWFRPVEIISGPDGALYIADFYNRIIGHYEVPLEHPGRDRLSGRIWRVRPAAGTSTTMPFTYALTKMNRECYLAENSADHRFPRADSPGELGLGDRVLGQVFQLWCELRTTGKASLLEDALASDSALFRRHGFLALAELWAADRVPSEEAVARQRLGQTTLAQSQIVKWITAGVNDSEAGVAMAALDAAARHPDLALLPALMPLATTGDPMQRYEVRVALKAVLTNTPADSRFSSTVNDFSESEVLCLAEVCLAVPGKTSAEFVLSHFSTLRSHPRFNDFVAYLTRNLAADKLPALIGQLDPATPRTIEQEWELLRALSEGLKRSNAKVPDELRDWARQMAERLLARCDQPGNQWSSFTADGLRPCPADQDPWGFQQRNNQEGQGIRVLSSIMQGETRTGMMVSPAFPLKAGLRFSLAGHRGYPDREQHDLNQVRLRLLDGEVIQQAFPPRNDVATVIQWNTESWPDQLARLEVVDGDAGDAYAWLAIGELEILEDGISQPELTLPTELPASRIASLEVVHQLKNEFQLSGLPKSNVSHAATGDLRLTLLRRALDFDDSIFLSTLCREAASGDIDHVGRRAVLELVAEWKSTVPTEALAKFSSYASTAAQRCLVTAAVEEEAVLELALASMESGKLSAEPLREAALQQAIALKLPAMAAQVRTLVEQLPALDEQWREKSRQRTEAYRQLLTTLQRGATVEVETGDERQRGSAEQWLASGKQVFAKNCAACHQIAGEGQVVGPQLDGIGQRGLDRVLEDVLLPNQNVDHAFRTTLFQLIDGRVISGLVKERDDQSLTLTDSSGKVATLSVDDIEQEKESPLSLMPEDAARQLPDADLFGLTYYLLQQKVTQSQQ